MSQRFEDWPFSLKPQVWHRCIDVESKFRCSHTCTKIRSDFQWAFYMHYLKLMAAACGYLHPLGKTTLLMHCRVGELWLLKRLKR